MPVYEGRRPGTHRVVVWVRGKPHEEIVEGTRDDARDREARMRIELRGPRAPSSATFWDFCLEQYAPHAEEHLAVSTWKVRQHHLATLAGFFGPTLLSEFTTELVDGFKAQRAAKVKASVVNLELKVLGTIMRWAKEDRSMPVADFKIRRLPQDGERRVHCWGGDALALAGPPTTSKGSSPRATARSALPSDAAGFPDQRLSDCVKAAGLKGGPHTTRHTYASHFLRAVPDLLLLARVLGHSSTRVTELYTHLLPGHLDEARNAVNLGQLPSTRPASRGNVIPFRTTTHRAGA